MKMGGYYCECSLAFTLMLGMDNVEISLGFVFLLQVTFQSVLIHLNC